MKTLGQLQVSDTFYLINYDDGDHIYDVCEKVVSIINDIAVGKIVKYLDSFTSSWNGRMYIMHDKTNRVYGVLNGFITSSIDEPDYFYIKEFIMLPDFRRKGFGTKLLMAVSRLLKCEDVNSLKLNVQTGSPDEAFFWIDGFSKSKSYLMELGI